MKSLIVYYSLTGNTKLIAESIKDEINSDILELKPINELEAGKFLTFLRGGFQAKMKRKPELKKYELKLDDYDLIFLGTCVWGWTISSPIRSFIRNEDLTDRKMALFTCSGGNGVKAMERFKRAVPSAEIIGEIRFSEPKANEPEDAKERARVWANSLLEIEK